MTQNSLNEALFLVMQKLLLILIFLSFPFLTSQAQAEKTFQIHSHNDYLQKVPFWTAYQAGASSIEVDLILKDGELMVAHEAASIDSKRTLKSLYLEPIRAGLKSGVIHALDFHLLVDLKTEAYATLEVLLQESEEFAELLFSAQNPGGLKMIISGKRPKLEDYASFPDWMLFDFQSKDLTADLPWEKIGMVSLSFRQFSVWNGKGRMVEKERQRVQEFIDLVHSFGKPARLWASPDSKSAWKAFYDMGEDYINTDHPFEAVKYLKSLGKNVYQNTEIHAVYQPDFVLDGAKSPVERVIFLIGDGNGLAQISAALFSNQNELNLTQLKNIGLIKTQAADDFTTDSAAGATALATGTKTNNRAIGVDPQGKPLENVTEILHEYGFSSGVITTDQLTGATPASYYAHQPERDDSKEIASFLAKSKLDLFIGGGALRFGPERENLLKSGFTLIQSLDQLSGSRVGYFAAEASLPLKQAGRGEFLLESTRAALDFFDARNSPFFLMIEAATIDSGGHANSTATIVSETLDFDLVVGEVVKYADEHPGTLVLITADHETGGVSLPQGNAEANTVELGYFSDDHTGILVPLFAYGAQSDEFRGVYENTMVFEKLMKLVKK